MSASKKPKINRGGQVWSPEHEQVVKQLFVDQRLDPNNIRKEQVQWIFSDASLPLLSLFDQSDSNKWRIFQRNLKRLATVYLSEQQAGGQRESK